MVRIGCPVAAGWLATAALNAQEVVQLPGEDRWLDADFEELYQIGSLTGAEWEQFGEVGKVAFDGAGHLYVFDSQAERIFVVGRDGTLVREIGRKGEGPGEFRMALEMVVREDGRVVVADLSRHAYLLFNASGDFERMVGMGGDPGLTAIGAHLAQRGTDALITGPAGPERTFMLASRRGMIELDDPTSRPIERIILSGEAASPPGTDDGSLEENREGATVEGTGGHVRRSAGRKNQRGDQRGGHDL